MSVTAIPADLPIRTAIPRVLDLLEHTPNLVVEAQPGAGKTTGVPLALLDASWCRGGRILMLEPRRLAARAAARRMAALLGEEVGDRVGYRVRLDSKIGPRTRIEVITDGIFSRMIQNDPELDGVVAVLFDEFHERRAETDLGLALALDAQSALRPDLRLIVMSATLDGAAMSALLGDAPRVAVEARAYPVERRYLPAPPLGGLIPALADVVERALAEPGGMLVFLPGGREIRQLQRRLAARSLGETVDVLPLFGDLNQAGQDRALDPAAPGRRKIVLATSIAETSLTIAGITQVIDGGLARQSRFDPRTLLSRLETVPVTKAAADQRAGRAGRTAPGICWRLWPEAAHAGLRPHPSAEMILADPTALVLSLAAWGVAGPEDLKLLDPPPAASLAAARRLLTGMEALDGDGRITAHGRAITGVGLPPRLAHMVLTARRQGDGALGCAVAALLSEGEDGGERDADLRSRLDRLKRDPAFARTRAIARQLARGLGIEWRDPEAAYAGGLLAAAFPDRIARRRGGGGRFLLSSGVGAMLPENDPLARETWLVVADLDGQTPDARIWLACPLTESELDDVAIANATVERQIAYDAPSRAVQARERRMLGSLMLDEHPLAGPDPAMVTAALLDGMRREGLDVLGWTASARGFRQRVAFMLLLDGPEAGWPALDDGSLLETAERWLGPSIGGLRSMAELGRVDPEPALRGLLARAQQIDLDRRAPAHWTAPTGSRLAIDYNSAGTPSVSVRLQELFGLSAHPTVGGGKVAIILHLLSPAQRPIQVTSDIAGFWRGSYRAVRADLRGRYPRHPWPEDPLAAEPTMRAKPRGR